MGDEPLSGGRRDDCRCRKGDIALSSNADEPKISLIFSDSDPRPVDPDLNDAYGDPDRVDMLTVSTVRDVTIQQCILTIERLSLMHCMVLVILVMTRAA